MQGITVLPISLHNRCFIQVNRIGVQLKRIILKSNKVNSTKATCKLAKAYNCSMSNTLSMDVYKSVSRHHRFNCSVGTREREYLPIPTHSDER